MKLSVNIFSLAHLALVTQTTLAAQYLGYSSQYSFDTNYLHAPQWMSAIPDSTNLTSLSIPGTHDTMTNFNNGPIFQCHNHRLGTQLEAGIRYFDIRARLNMNELLIYHEDSYTGFSYVDVLTTFFKFLDKNPGETILMRLKEEATPIASTTDFITAFNNYRLKDSCTAPGSKKHFWVPPAPGTTVVPTLGPLRSKILILQNFGPEPAEYGIKWESPSLSIQDDYIVNGLYKGMDDKFAAIKAGLESADVGTKAGDGKLYLGHLSGSGYVLPIQCAAGTITGSVVGMNDRTGKYLKEGSWGKTGVVIIDFPGASLVQQVLRRN